MAVLFRGGVVQVVSDLGSLTARGSVVARFGTPSSNRNSVVIVGPRERRMNKCNVSGPRTMQSVVINATIADYGATDSGAASEQEMLRRADSYFATDSRPIVLFDGVCNFCNAGVNIVLDNDPEGRVRMAALQSEAGRALLLRAGRASDDLSSLVLVEKDGSYIKSEGVLRTAQYLGNLLPPIGGLGLLFPLFFRDFVYDNIANNRYSLFGKRNQCRVSDSRFNDRFVL